MNTTVAFLGTGLMGAPMATRLVRAGFRTQVWNRSHEKAAALKQAGAIVCTSPAEAAADASFVCLCLTDAAAVEDVLFGQTALADALSDKSVVIDFSTIGVTSAEKLASRVMNLSGAAWLDCPVSGGVAGAKAGSLVIFAGGEPAMLERATPLLNQLSARVTHMGGVGSGQAAKLCNQLIVTVNLVAIAEAISLGEALGVDVAQLPAALGGGFADSIPLQIFGPRMAALDDPGPIVGALRTMQKDIEAILDAARDSRATVTLLEHVDSLYRRLLDAGLGSEDLPALMRLYRDKKIRPC